MHIGADQAPGPYIKGLMDDERIYRRALAPAEILSGMGQAVP